MNTENNRKTRLQKLSGSDFEIAAGQPGIIGWNVIDSAGKTVGVVNELIFDYQNLKVRYLVVGLNGNYYGLQEKDVLVPIGIAELHESEDQVLLPGITPGQIIALPEYDEDRFDTEHEENVRNVFGGLGESALNGGSENDTGFYNHGHFDEAHLYRNRSGNLSKADNPENEWQKINPGGVRLRLGIADATGFSDIGIAPKK